MRIRTRSGVLLLICFWAATQLTAGAADAIKLQGGTVDPDGKTVWFNAQQLGIEGKGGEDTEVPCDRLPHRPAMSLSTDKHSPRRIMSPS